MRVYILGYPFEIQEVDSLIDYGECNTLERAIKISRNQSKAEKADTLWHELTHATWHLMDVGNRAKEERLATAIGRAFGSIWADPRNREFLDYLKALECISLSG